MIEQYRDKFRRPELFLQEILRKGSSGMFVERDETLPFLFRAVVVAVDVEGSRLENPTASGGLTYSLNGKSVDVKARQGPENPKNSIKARIITDGLDKFSTDENLRVFWPFFPEGIAVSVKPGEHVYVVFEDQKQTHGLWITKVPGHVGLNYAPGRDFYSQRQSSLASKFDDTNIDTSKKKFDDDKSASETVSKNKLSSLF